MAHGTCSTAPGIRSRAPSARSPARRRTQCRWGSRCPGSTACCPCTAAASLASCCPAAPRRSPQSTGFIFSAHQYLRSLEKSKHLTVVCKCSTRPNSLYLRFSRPQRERKNEPQTQPERLIYGQEGLTRGSRTEPGRFADVLWCR